MKSIRSSTVVKFLALALLAGIFSIGNLEAQQAAPATTGEFTLPFEVHWGKAILPPGDYSFTVANAGTATLITIRGKKQSAFVMTASTADCNSCGSSALLILRTGKERSVQALRLAKLGVVLYYSPRRGVEELIAQAPKTLERVPVLVASH